MPADAAREAAHGLAVNDNEPEMELAEQSAVGAAHWAVRQRVSLADACAVLDKYLAEMRAAGYELRPVRAGEEGEHG